MLTQAHTTEIARLLKQAADGSLAHAMGRLVRYLLQEGLAYRQVVHCSLIGVHPQNRDGLGLDVSHVQELCNSISELGFVGEKATGIAVEIGADDNGMEVQRFNLQLAESAEGKLGICEAKMLLRYASLAGSHANQACRAVWYSAVHPNPELTVNGKLSMEKIPTAWADSIRQGHEWVIVRSEVENAFPDYPRLQQSAENSIQQTSKPEDDLQIVMKMSRAVELHLQMHSGCTYKDIQSEILRSRPPKTAAFPHIFSFVMRLGGGAGGGAFLVESENYIRSHGMPSRSLGPQLWDALSFEMKGRQHVMWRHMLLKYAFCCEEDKALTASDVRRALTNKAVVASSHKAETLLLEFKKVVEASLPDEGWKASKWCGSLAVEMVPIVLAKKKAMKFETIEEAAHATLLSLAEAVGRPIASQWKPNKSAAPAVAAKASPKSASAPLDRNARRFII